MADKKIWIRAKSTLKLATVDGNNLTYEYPKNVPIEALLRDILRAHQYNIGYEDCYKTVTEIIDQQAKIAKENVDE